VILTPVMLTPPEFFRSTSSIRPRSKIGWNKIPGVCLGFCQSASVPLVAKKTGLSVKAVRALYKSMRGLLLDPRYRKWHGFDNLPIYEFKNLAQVEAEIWRCFAECYFNDECFRNYRYGKRSERQCQACPVHRSPILQEVLPKELIATMLQHIETVRAYYQVLIGLSRDMDMDRAESFRLRLYHTMIVLSAKMTSSRVEDGVVKSSMLIEGPNTLNELWMTILRHIEERGSI